MGTSLNLPYLCLCSCFLRMPASKCHFGGKDKRFQRTVAPLRGSFLRLWRKRSQRVRPSYMMCRPWLRPDSFAPCSISFRTQGESTALTCSMPFPPQTCCSRGQRREMTNWSTLKMSCGFCSDAVESRSLAFHWAKLVGCMCFLNLQEALWVLM